VTSRFATVGAICTALGIVLGMLWSHSEWNRYWGWDSKEIGGLAVIVWMLAFLLAHRFQRITPRTLLVATLLGSNVVLLAWFGPRFILGLHAYALSNAASLALIAAFIFNLFLTFLGLAPAGCLRFRKT
jgi:ABC-type transport system involved in cytochrome c biogenesis permease subunit